MKKFLISLFAIVSLFSWGNYVWATAVQCVKTDWGYTCSSGTTAAPVIQDTWVTSTAYTYGMKVSQSGHLYKCLVAHTSGTFATDLTAKDWVKIGESTVWVTQVNFYPAASTDISQFTASASNWSAMTLTANQANVSFVPTPTSVEGQNFWNLLVAHTNTSDVTNLYVSMDNFTEN